MIIVSVKEAIPNSKVKKGDVVKAVVVRTAKEVRRPGWILHPLRRQLGGLNQQPGRDRSGPRIFGPVARELRAKRYMKIISLAPEVL